MPRKQREATPRRRGNGKRAASESAPSSTATASIAAAPGAEELTDGLDALDRERASSLADEGGTAGAIVEAQPSQPATVARSAAGKVWPAASWGLAGLAALYLRRSR